MSPYDAIATTEQSDPYGGIATTEGVSVAPAPETLAKYNQLFAGPEKLSAIGNDAPSLIGLNPADALMAKQRALNQSAAANLAGVSPVDIAANWPGVKSAIAKSSGLDVDGEPSEQQIYGVIGDGLRKQAKTTDSLLAMTQEMLPAVMAGESWQSARTAYISAHVGDPGFDLKAHNDTAERFRVAEQTYVEKYGASVQSVAKAFLENQTSNADQSQNVEAAIATMKALPTDADRRMVAELAALHVAHVLAPKEGDQSDARGIVSKTGETLNRSVLRMADAVGGVAFSIPAGAGPGYTGITDATGQSGLDAAHDDFKARLMLRNAYDAIADPMASRVYYRLVSGVPNIAMVMAQPHIAAGILLGAAHEERISAGQGPAQAAVGAVTDTLQNFIGGNLVFKGTFKAMEEAAVTTLKQVAVNAGKRAMADSGIFFGAAVSGQVLPQLAAALDGAAPDGHSFSFAETWKQLKDAAPETAASAVLMSLVATGAGAVRDVARLDAFTMDAKAWAVTGLFTDAEGRRIAALPTLDARVSEATKIVAETKDRPVQAEAQKAAVVAMDADVAAQKGTPGPAEATAEAAPPKAYVMPASEPGGPVTVRDGQTGEVVTHAATPLEAADEVARHEAAKVSPAVPAETVEGQPLPTPSQQASTPALPEGVSVNNASIDAQLAARGLKPLSEADHIAQTSSHDEALRRMQADPAAAQKLVERMEADAAAGKTPFADHVEQAMLSIEAAKWENARAEAAGHLAEIEELPESPEKAALLEQAAQADALAQDRFERFAEATQRAGTDPARALAMRARYVLSDYSLAGLTHLVKKAGGGEELTPKQAKQVADLTKQLSETSARLTEAQASLAAAKGRGLEAPAPGTRRRPTPRATTATNRLRAYLKTEADAAWAELQKKTGQLNAGFDVSMIPLLAKIGAHYLAEGIAYTGEKFGEWGRTMRERFGEEIEPHLQAVLDESNKVHAEALERIHQDLLEAKKVRLQKEIGRLREKVESGDLSAKPKKSDRPSVAEVETLEQERDGLREKLGAMREAAAKVKELTEAIAEKERKISEADLSAESPAVNRPGADPAIEALKQQRDTLNRELAEARKEAAKPTEEEKIQKHVETLTERITDAREKLATGDISPAQKAANRPQSEAIEKAKQELEALNRELAEARKPAPDTPEQARVKELDRQIKAIEEQLASGELFTPGKKTAPDSPAIRERQAKLDALKAERQSARDTIQPPSDPAANSLDAYKAKLAKRIEEIQAENTAMEAGLPKATRPEKALMELDAETKELLTKKKGLEDRAKQLVAEAEEAAKPAWQRRMDAVAGVAHASALSGYHVLGKVLAFTAGRTIGTPLHELTAYLLSRARITPEATLEGGKPEIGRYYATMATRGLAAAREQLLTGTTKERTLSGQGRTGVSHWWDYFGARLHAAETAPEWTGAFEMYLAKRVSAAESEGLNVDDEMVKAALRKEAGDYANRHNLREENAAAKKLSELIGMLKKKNPETGEPNVLSYAIGTFIDAEITKSIVRLPMNHAWQTAEASPAGLAAGLFKRAAIALREGRGAAPMTPVEANIVSRLIAGGALGSAMFAWGAINAMKPDKDRIFGGFYEPRDHRGKDDVPVTTIRLGGVNIPRIASLNPLVLMGQLGSTFTRVAQSKLKKTDREDAGVTAALIVSAMAVAQQAPVASQLPTLGKLGEASSVDDAIGRIVAGNVPQLVREIAQDTDPEKKRKTKGVVDNLKAALPGLRETLPKPK